MTFLDWEVADDGLMSNRETGQSVFQTYSGVTGQPTGQEVSYYLLDAARGIVEAREIKPMAA